MTSPVVGEYPEKDGTWKKRKRIAVKEALENLTHLHSVEPRKSGGRPPRRKLSFCNYDVHACERDIAECVEVALSYWNEKSRSKQGPEYELVDALGCVRAKVPVIMPDSFHCNFSARPKNGNEDEIYLFFADLTVKNGVTLTCCSCRILGLSGTKTGLSGCKICSSLPDLVQHPANGRFRKKIPKRPF